MKSRCPTFHQRMRVLHASRTTPSPELGCLLFSSVHISLIAFSFIATASLQSVTFTKFQVRRRRPQPITNLLEWFPRFHMHHFILTYFLTSHIINLPFLFQELYLPKSYLHLLGAP
ncbi:hypothetical protein F4805DRAFT_241374 [Annulohypoxylon moriforme]|nr:hypothetical protein F4805DRAFT_241374 [Annulohypoxylon moriforme]